MKATPYLIFLAAVLVCMSHQLHAALETNYETIEFKTSDNEPISLSDSTSNFKKKKVFICVTGQLARLELENKVRNIILPLQEAGFKTDLALVLSAGQAKYTNKNREDGVFEDAQSVVSFLSEYPSINFLRDEDFISDFVEKPGFPVFYAERLYSTRKHGWHHAKQRSENHIRIFGSYQKCWDIAEKQRIKSGTIYDSFIRVREDIGLPKPIDTSLVDSVSQLSWDNEVGGSVKSKTMIVTDCRSSRGINDRMALVSPAAAEEYFMRPLQVVLRGEHPTTIDAEEYPLLDWQKVDNSESYFKTLYEACNITIIQSSRLRGVNRIDRRPLANGMIGYAFAKEDLNWPDCPKEFHP